MQHAGTIPAPREMVWAVLTDFAAWGRWLPTITECRQVSGTMLEIGAEYEIRQPMQVPKIWTVTEFESEHLFQWENSEFRARHELRDKGNATISVTSLDWQEPPAGMQRLIRPILYLAIRSENIALKKRIQQMKAKG